MTDKNVQSTQDESIEESLRKIIKAYQNQIYTCMPGKIEKIYNLNNKRLVDVKPMIMDTRIIDGDKTSIDYPVFPMVPLFIQGTEEFFSSFPVKAGNPCMLYFIQHNHDLYLKSDGKTVIDSEDIRRHDVNSAFCVVGNILPTFNISAISANDMVMGKVDGSAEIVITSDNKVEVKADRVNLGTLTASKALALAEKVDANFSSLVTSYNLHVHPVISLGAPSGVPVVPLGSFAGTDSTKVFTNS